MAHVITQAAIEATKAGVQVMAVTMAEAGTEGRWICMEGTYL